MGFGFNICSVRSLVSASALSESLSPNEKTPSFFGWSFVSVRI